MIKLLGTEACHLFLAGLLVLFNGLGSQFLVGNTNIRDLDMLIIVTTRIEDAISKCRNNTILDKLTDPAGIAEILRLFLERLFDKCRSPCG